jgi:hypothetical protein
MKTEFNMISKLLSITSAAALAIIILSTPSQANQLIVSGTPGFGLGFTAVGGNALQVTSVTDGFQGIGEYKDPSLPDPTADPAYSTGFAQFGPINGVFCSSGSCGSFQTGAETNGVFPITDPAANQSFSYQSNSTTPVDAPGADFLTANITWTELDSNDNLMTGEPQGESQLIGTGAVTGLAGDTMFTTDFSSGVFDIVANFPPSNTASCSLTQLALGPPPVPPCPVTFEIFSFEGSDATPAPIIITTPIVTTPGVPEPMSSSMALGLALFCLWGTYQLRRRSRCHSAVPA